MYKLSKTNIFFSRFEGTRGEKNQIFRTLDIEPLQNDGVWDRIRNLLRNSSVPLNSSVVLTVASFIILQLTSHN